MNFDAFHAPEIRDLLKTKAHLLRAGMPKDHAVIETFSQIIAVYRKRVGLKDYLSQMLAEVANTPTRECLLYWASGERVPLELPEADTQPVQRFLARRFRYDQELPFRVVAGGQEKYL